MYTISRLTHEKYGSIILIERIEAGSFLVPFFAVQAAIKEQRLWLEEGAKKVRILIDDQVMSHKQAEQWATEEYTQLPKCAACATVLNEELHQHQFSDDFYCSIQCADRAYDEWIEKLKDEEEAEHL